MMRLILLVAALLIAAPASAQVVGIFAGDEAEPVASGPVEVACGPSVFGTQVGILKPADDQLCFADLDSLTAGLTPGTYRVALQTPTGWGEKGLPFILAPPKTCVDGGTVYGLGEGPPVQAMGNSSVSQRAAWLARERLLISAGFDVRMLLVSTSVYVAATCREFRGGPR
jgi:hypothetical protein